MKKLMIVLLLATLQAVGCYAQNPTLARKVLDKTAAVVGNKKGASARFTVTGSKIGSASGTIAIKGSMYHVSTPKAIVWFNGKTQWSYLKSTNEVNVTTPSAAQRAKMNPYAFITLYKSGYKLGVTTKGGNQVVHMTAQNKNQPVQEIYLTINSKTYVPSMVKMKQNGTWTNISISGFTAKSLPNSTFTFRQKDFPSAEVVDLR
jgi:outer membrane lipoprotein-sorting protein